MDYERVGTDGRTEFEYAIMRFLEGGPIEAAKKAVQARFALLRRVGNRNVKTLALVEESVRDCERKCGRSLTNAEWHRLLDPLAACFSESGRGAAATAP